jgi:hypothetical protein
MLLDEKEIEQLTGYKQHKKQIQWLRSNGIEHLIGIDGSPRVAKERIDQLLGVLNIHKSKKRTEPNYKAFEQHLGIA